MEQKRVILLIEGFQFINVKEIKKMQKLLGKHYGNNCRQDPWIVANFG